MHVTSQRTIGARWTKNITKTNLQATTNATSDGAQSSNIRKRAFSNTLLASPFSNQPSGYPELLSSRGARGEMSPPTAQLPATRHKSRRGKRTSKPKPPLAMPVKPGLLQLEGINVNRQVLYRNFHEIKVIERQKGLERSQLYLVELTESKDGNKVHIMLFIDHEKPNQYLHVSLTSKQFNKFLNWCFGIHQLFVATFLHVKHDKLWVSGYHDNNDPRVTNPLFQQMRDNFIEQLKQK